MTLNELIKAMQEEAVKYGDYEVVEVNISGEQDELIIHKDDIEKVITIW